MTKPAKIYLGITLAVIVLGGSYLYSALRGQARIPGSDGRVCAMDAKLCPDGSYVGRTGPACAFAACPGSLATSTDSEPGWLIHTDEDTGATLEYPAVLPARYMTATDWPPELELLNGSFTCKEAGSETARAGLTEKVSIDGRDYCVTRVTEGAAGSIYTMHAYSTQRGSDLLILTFGTKSPQCANYAAAEKKVCESERSSFDLHAVIGKIAETVETR